MKNDPIRWPIDVKHDGIWDMNRDFVFRNPPNSVVPGVTLQGAPLFGASVSGDIDLADFDWKHTIYLWSISYFVAHIFCRNATPMPNSGAPFSGQVHEHDLENFQEVQE